MEKRIQGFVDEHMHGFKEFTRSIVLDEGMSQNEKLEKIYVRAVLY